MASLVCSKTDEEMPQIFDPKAINLEAIERKGESTLEKRMSRIRDTGKQGDLDILQFGGDLIWIPPFSRVSV